MEVNKSFFKNIKTNKPVNKYALTIISFKVKVFNKNFNIIKYDKYNIANIITRLCKFIYINKYINIDLF